MHTVPLSQGSKAPSRCKALSNLLASEADAIATNTSSGLAFSCSIVATGKNNYTAKACATSTGSYGAAEWMAGVKVHSRCGKMWGVKAGATKKAA